MSKRLFILLISLACILYSICLQAQFVSIPNANFRTWLTNHGFAGCMNGTLLDTTCSAVVNATTINCASSSINNLTGIQYFDNLSLLNCSFNILTSLPALPPHLDTLYCGNNNNLTSLPQLPSTLKVLECPSTKINTLPSLPAALTVLNCGSDSLAVFPQLPAGLIHLYCGNTKISSLPVLPVNLKTLACNTNQITSLPNLPSTLTFLYCDGNPLTSLPTLPAGLTGLACSSTQLTNLPALPNSITDINCSYSLLTSVPTLPTSLKTFMCSANQLTSLPALPSSITALYCTNNLLTTLPALPSALKTFQCQSNQLTSMPALPSGITYLQCNNNQLTSLPALPAALATLYCHNNLLTSLPAIPLATTNLNCSSNQITSIPALRDTMNALDCSNNNGITCMPAVKRIGQFIWTNTGIKCFSSAFTVFASNPSILTIPVCNQPVISGAATACGQTTLTANGGTTFQWRYNGNTINGATGSTYIATASGAYSCQTTTSCGTYVSSAFNVTINPLPAATITASGPLSFCFGDSVVLSAVTGTGLTYKWRNVPGGFTISTLSSYTAKTAGSYTVQVTDPNGCSATSSAYVVTLPSQSVPAITGTAMVCSGNTSVLTVTGGSSFQWYKDNILIPGATSSTYTASLSGSYTCTSISCDTFISAPFAFTAISAPAVTITSSIAPVLCPGTTTTLTANPSTGYIYQWYKDGVAIPSATSSTYSANIAGNYSVKVTHTLGCFPEVTSNTIAVSIATPPTAAISTPAPAMGCNGGSLALNANTAPGYIYKWYSGSAVEIPGQTAATYIATGNGNYYVKITDSNGCTDTSEAVTVLLGAPAATITSTSPATLCTGTWYQLTAPANGQATSYQWKKNGTSIPGANSYWFNVPGSGGNIYTVEMTNQCGTALSAPWVENSIPAPTVSITASGPTAFCAPGSVTLNATTTGSNLKYQWYQNYTNMPVGTNSPSYTATGAGNHLLLVKDTISGCSVYSNRIPVSTTGTFISLSPSIQSPYGACSSFVFTASAIPAGYTYEWVRNGVVVPGVTTQTYTTTTLASPHQGISYDTYFVRAIGSCGTTVSNSVGLELRNQRLDSTGVIVYPQSTTACEGDSIGIGINRWVTDYYLQDVAIQWKLNGVAIPGATANWYYAKTSGTYTIDVTIPCGTTSSINAAVLTFQHSPVAVISSNGTSLCGAGTSVGFNITTEPGNTYQWKNNNQVVNGANNSIYTATVPGTYTCTATGTNGCKSNSNYINVFYGLNGNLSVKGSAGFCRPSTGNIYTATALNGAAYNWTVPAGATITSGQGTNSITVSFASNASAGNISVALTSNCGNAAASKAIIVRSAIPSVPGTISGVNNGCNGESKSYKIRTVTNADQYQWTPPAGASINGSSAPFVTSDTFVNVTFGAGFTGDTLRVRSINCKGMSAERKLRINGNAPGTPGTISGLNVGLCNQINVGYSITPVTNATSYTWRTNIPGIAFNGSASPYTTTSTSINVTYPTFTSGQIYVKANSDCGSSAERSLTVNAKPAVPSIITGPASVCDGDTGIIYSTPGVLNATGYNWTVPTGATVASGQNTTSIKVNFGANPATGNVRVRTQNSCAFSSYFTKSVTINNCPRLSNNEISEIKIQPNPFTKTTTIILPEEVDASVCELNVYDMFGRLVRTISNPGSTILQFERENLSPGIYNLELIYNKKHSVTKLILN